MNFVTRRHDKHCLWVAVWRGIIVRLYLVLSTIENKLCIIIERYSRCNDVLAVDNGPRLPAIIQTGLVIESQRTANALCYHMIDLHQRTRIWFCMMKQWIRHHLLYIPVRSASKRKIHRSRLVRFMSHMFRALGYPSILNFRSAHTHNGLGKLRTFRCDGWGHSRTSGTSPWV